MKILITGGAGFIGSHLSDALLAAGHEITIVDDLSSGTKDFLPKEAEFLEMDIRKQRRPWFPLLLIIPIWTRI